MISPTFLSSCLLLVSGLPMLVDAQQSTGGGTYLMAMNETMFMNETMLNSSMYDAMPDSSFNESSKEVMPEDMVEDEPVPASSSQFTIVIPIPQPTSLAPTSTPTAEPTVEPTLPVIRNCVDNPVTDDEIQLIRTAIVDFIEEEDNINYPAKFVRLGFHFCVGGCDGCVDMSDPENAGLEVPIEGLAGIVAEFENECVSRADIWALAALVGAEYTQDEIEFPMVWVGRRNCGAEDPMNGPAALMPSADMDIHSLLDYFNNEFGFGPQEVVALLGAHSIGTVDEDNSGFVGRGFDDDNELLDNDYYRQLQNDVRWNQVNANRRQWEGGRGGSGDADEDGILMMNIDIALVRDFSAFLEGDGDVDCRFRNRGNNNRPVCPNAAQTIGFVQDYTDDNALFLNDFRDVIGRMLVRGYDTSSGCDSSDPCPFPGAFTSVSKSGSETGPLFGDYWG